MIRELTSILPLAELRVFFINSAMHTAERHLARKIPVLSGMGEVLRVSKNGVGAEADTCRPRSVVPSAVASWKQGSFQGASIHMILVL
jgi:hypothetical protein